MSSPFHELANLDRTVHAPPRLAILTVLLNCTQADFTFLLTATGLTNGNLASNLTALETARLIESQKDIDGRRPRTNYRLTGHGQEVIEAHWDSLERIKQQTLPTPAPTT